MLADATHDYVRLAEEDGAHFCQIRTTGLWGVSDRDGMIVVPYVDGAMSKVEAARLYCEEKGLAASTPGAILSRIASQYRPYHTLPAFHEGYRAYRADGAFRVNPYEAEVAGETIAQSLQRQVNGQAWDRGANAAMLHRQALSCLDDPSPEVERAAAIAAGEKPQEPPAVPSWLTRLVSKGRR